MANEPEANEPEVELTPAQETVAAMRGAMSPEDIKRFCSPESIAVQTALMKAMIQKNPSMADLVASPELLCAALQAPLPKAPKTR